MLWWILFWPLRAIAAEFVPRWLTGSGEKHFYLLINKRSACNWAHTPHGVGDIAAKTKLPRFLFPEASRFTKTILSGTLAVPFLTYTL
jgi:hypothetical protein